MASLSSHGNVYNICLLVLHRKGYKLWVEQYIENTRNNVAHIPIYTWKAKKNDYDFAADDPIQLLGLVSVYEHIEPSNILTPYWWTTNDDQAESIYREIMNNIVNVVLDESEEDE
jgi:hypothetical protein